METKHTIYPEKLQAYKREVINLEKENISPENKTLISEFNEYLFSKGSKQLRVAKVSSQLRALCRWLQGLGIQKPINSLEKGDLVRVVSFINTLETHADATKADYRRALKQFYAWYQDEDKRVYSKDEDSKLKAKKVYKYILKEVRVDYKGKKADPNIVINDEDCMQVIEKGCKSPRERLFIRLLHETGCRASEFLNLKIGNISLDSSLSYAQIHVPDGKTGERTIIISQSVPYLIKFLEVHPKKEDQNAFLWLSESRSNLNEPLLHKGAQKLIDRCFEKANITKKHNFHWFRHSRATLLAPKLNETLLKEYMGWTAGSDQVKTYVHLCKKQLKDAFLEMHGIKEHKQDEKPIRCSCGTLNHITEEYCRRCYRALRIETKITEKERMQNEIGSIVTQFLSQASKDPNFLKEFEQFKKEKEVPQ